VRRRLTERAVTERSAEPAAVSAWGAKTARGGRVQGFGRVPEGSQGNGVKLPTVILLRADEVIE
jgi:hypothetical protein